MSKIQFAALAAALITAVPALAQETYTPTPTTPVQATPPSTVQEDAMKAQREQERLVADDDTHWTLKRRTELLMNAPYLRPRHMWEINHLFRTLTGYEEKVLFKALTNALRANAGDFYTRQDAMDRYWTERYNKVTTTTTTTPAGETTVTTVQTFPTEGVRAQVIAPGMVIASSMSSLEVYDLLLRDIDAEERTTVRMIWDNMTEAQMDAIIDTVRFSKRYYTNRFMSPF